MFFIIIIFLWNVMVNAQPNFIFKPLQVNDLPLLLSWFKQPHVSQWWPVPHEQEDFFNHFLPRIRSTKLFAYLIYLDQIPIGYIQYYAIDHAKSWWLPSLPEYTIGTDQFIGDPEYIGQGYGTHFMKAFIEFIKINKSDIAALIVDPEPINYAAIRCYEKVGFQKMGEYQTPHGPALVMRYDINKE